MSHSFEKKKSHNKKRASRKNTPEKGELERVKEDAGGRGGAEAVEARRGGDFRVVFDLLPDATVLCDAAGRIVEFNRAAERLFGSKRERLLGKNVSLLMPSPYREQHDRFIRQYLKTGTRKLMGKNRELPAVRSDGVLFPAELQVAPVDAGSAAAFQVPAGCGPPIALATVRDLTEKKLKAVLETPQRYAQEFDELLPLGEGQFGAVFLAHHVLDHQLYAVKQVPLRRRFAPLLPGDTAAAVLTPDFDDITSTLTADLREVTLCASLPPHRNVLRYYSAWIQEVPWQALAFENELMTAASTNIHDEAGDVIPYLPPAIGPSPAAAAPAAAAAAGQQQRRVRASDFRVLSQLGAGAFGQVFLVEHRHTRRKYALKAILRSAIHSKNAWKRVKRERNSMMRVSGHGQASGGGGDGASSSPQLHDQSPRSYGSSGSGLGDADEAAMRHFVVQLHACFHTKLSYYFLMEYAPGGDLATLIDTLGRLAEHVARVYVCELVLALGYLHEHGIIHRDIKPDNVLVAADGHLKLTDFGLAAPVAEDDRERESMVGTLAYIAPEVLTGEGHSFEVDWWSLGVTTYTMLTGTNPWVPRDVPSMVAATHRGLPRWPRHASSVSANARDFCADLLQVNPGNRLGSTTGFREVQRHSWLRNVNWDAVLTTANPPFVPDLENSSDVGYFDRAKPMSAEDADANPDEAIRHKLGPTAGDSDTDSSSSGEHGSAQEGTAAAGVGGGVLDSSVSLQFSFEGDTVSRAAAAARRATPSPHSSPSKKKSGSSGAAAATADSSHHSSSDDDDDDDDDDGQRAPSPRALLRRRGMETGVETVQILYLQMQYCPGLSMYQWLAQPDRPCLSMSAALTVLAQVAAGLCHVHAAGIVHRDLKPSNIFISSAEARDRVIRLLNEGTEGSVPLNASSGSNSASNSSNTARRRSSVGSATGTPPRAGLLRTSGGGGGGGHRTSPSASPRMGGNDSEEMAALRGRMTREVAEMLNRYEPSAVSGLTFVIGDFGISLLNEHQQRHGTADLGYQRQQTQHQLGSTSAAGGGGPPRPQHHAKENRAGALLYAAPEQLAAAAGVGGRSPAAAAAALVNAPADMFSLGMVFAELLLPPDDDGKRDGSTSHKRLRRLRKIRSRDYGSWLRRNRPDALPLLDTLLQPDPSRRLTAAQLLHHPQVAPFHSASEVAAM